MENYTDEKKNIKLINNLLAYALMIDNILTKKIMNNEINND